MTQKKDNKTKRGKVKKPSFIIPFIPYIPFLAISMLVIGLIVSFLDRGRVGSKASCDITHELTIQANPQNIQADITANETNCYRFEGISGQSIMVDTNIKTTLLFPDNQSQAFSGKSQYILPNTGTYFLKVTSAKEKELYQLKILLESQSAIATAPSPNRTIIPAPTPYPAVRTQISYNVQNPPSFRSDAQLQEIVDDILDMIQSQGLSKNNLSISLINLNGTNCCSYASYSDSQPIFPASVAKLFWLVALYGQYNAGIIPEGTISEQDVYKMIQDSDNEPASRIVDMMTGTESGSELTPEELKTWIDKRLWMNHFFERAGYKNINISQKNFPIPYLNLKLPDQGRDLQIRGKNAVPIRNYLTSFDAARLLYEIDTGQAISREYSVKIKGLLRRNLNPEVWKKIEYNSIAGFFAESLPLDSRVFSKVGWTSGGRQDAAIIESPDGKVRFILVIFAESKGFSEDWKIFPNISQMVYRQMMNNFSN